MEPGQVKEIFEDAIAAAFEKRDLDSKFRRDVHTEHHQWLSEHIAKEAEKAEFWRNIRNKSVPWAIVALTSSLGAGIWALLKTYFSEHWK